MISEFKQHLQNNFPQLTDNKFIIAVSGGIDSVVLAHLCHQLNLNFGIAHCNFYLRNEESNLDESFVKDLANQMNKEFHTISFDTKEYAKKEKLSIQLAARELRYNWFYELLDKQNYSYVLTAHNANDQLETFLLNLTRGSGLDGFTGIPSVNNKTLRPLLSFSRIQIEAFARDNNIQWREDGSNAETKYVRNKIRHEVIPVLKSLNPQLLDTFQQTLQNLNQSKQLINNHIETISNDVIHQQGKLLKFDIHKIKQLSNPKAYLYEFLKSYGFTEWNDVLNLLEAQSGKQVFSKTHRLIKDRTSLLLTEISKSSNNSIYQINSSENKITQPISITFSISNKEEVTNKQTIFVDKELLKYPLTVRKWKDGDYICPTGMKGRKKLSQLFKDQKLSLLEKEDIWILSNADDAIIWVIGLRQDRRFAITKNTQNILKITHQK